MDVIPKKYVQIEKKIRVFLVFFSLILFISCKDNKPYPYYQFEYDKQNNPTKLIFWGEGDQKEYSVKLKGKSNSMFGDLQQEGSQFSFAPIIPFTTGETYEVYRNDEAYFEFTIRKPEKKIVAKLLGIYPKLDTVPENLLKMYFVFDKPMQQSRSTLDFIKVFNETGNEEVEIFLPLENELWNKDRTRLTLWLDPGRIKKDLIPNKERGIPIQEGFQYTVKVSKDLEDQQGNTLDKGYEKSFFIESRDEEKPSVKSWQLTVPEIHTKSGLGIDFNESLDSFLVEETIKIFKNKEEIKGSFFISKKANSVVFIPSQSWTKGKYQIQIESRLEDLAGNNLNRLFDEDLQKNSGVKSTEFKILEFSIE